MKDASARLVVLFLVTALVLGGLPAPGARAQDVDPVAQLMEQMSSATKVGQLFMVTFPGSRVDDDAAIAELIQDYQVGGVLLKADNGNIVNAGDTPGQVADLTTQLQHTAWEATRAVTGTVEQPFVPLFVATSQEGNGMPYTSIVSGTTPLPSQMALGATWDISHTVTIGQIVGQELGALGVNMLLGPSLDVLENPRAASTGDLGVRAFGGEPFWVGQMGKAYIQGVHEGGQGRVAVVAKHFPGLGSSDRSLTDEVSTVQRTLEKLKQVDLAPFFAVAQAPSELARPDGVLVSHIRFQGLGGGRFITTLPISVDSNVLQQLLDLPEILPWREAGGVTLSDELGLRALRRFYDPGEGAFNPRRVAQDAFLAGNDLLLLSQFALSDDWDDQLANVRSTITFFREKYETDAAFQTQVDAAVARILRLKLSLYDSSFTINRVRPDANAARDAMQQDVEAVSAMARDAVTLLSPPSADLVPSPPTREDRIVIITDGREGRPCATCDPEPFIDPQALEDTIVQFYGPDATSQVAPQLISSFTFSQLEAYLDTPAVISAPATSIPETGEAVTVTVTPRPPTIGEALQTADWVVFGMLNTDNGPPEAAAVKRFLAERVGSLQNPRLVVMAYDVPYCLDATEISKLSAYYATYSHLTPFIHASVRALFGEYTPRGDPPVSIGGINYDLRVQTAPDPAQTITVDYSVVRPAEGEGTPTPGEEEPTPEPPPEGESPAETAESADEIESTPDTRLERGNELRLRTSPIVDRNGHLVPDGTPVHFVFNYPQEGLEQSILSTTRDGVAEATLTLDRTGRLDISVQADPVPRTVALQIAIQEGGAATIVTPTPSPTLEPTATSTPTLTPEPTQESGVTPVSSPTVDPSTQPVWEPSPPPPSPEARVWGFLLALFGAGIVAGSSYYAMRLGERAVTRALRIALWCLIGGLSIYLVYVLGLSYLDLLDGQGEAWMAGGAALLGSSVALLFAWLRDRRPWSRSV